MLFITSVIFALVLICVDADARIGGNKPMGKIKTKEYVPSDTMVEAAKAYLADNPVFKNATTDEDFRRVITDVMSYDMPEFIVRNFPYYLSGYTYYENPLWIVEAGKFNFTALVDQGPDMLKAADMAILQAAARVLISMENAPGGMISCRADTILDFEGMALEQIATPADLAFIFQLGRRYRILADQYLGEAYLINVSYAIGTVINLIRPIMGRVFERVQQFGNNQASWKPVLNRVFPHTALPHWYGGAKDFKPLAVYG